ncbi:hypothetical protein B5V46_00920 [Rhodovulum sp. MB263]|nr:hypothetical protein B5V46_00920 [Rhodovulum sp. MB263]
MAVSVGMAVSGPGGAASAEGFRSEKAIPGTSVLHWLAPKPGSKPEPPRSGKAARKAAVLALDRRQGRGSHICSPAGFGQRPRCVSR